ncbi:MAG: 50S ribosomal protein L3 [Acidobacteria bacterium]|nr:50S ribosomal protein L3 [Acidobacteriota bacterium]MCB9378382.1 50S ribosomal protein L3 [Holophagales bacterium]
MDGILGRKLGMTQIFTDDGATVPVTVVEAGPCVVLALKTIDRDGYEAVQLGLVEAQPPRRVTKPQLGHFKKSGSSPVRKLAEFVADPGESWELGDQVKVGIFQEKDWVDVVGTSKGKGYQGVMKRHNFRGGRASHGSMFHRAPGSIGGSSNPSRVFPGMKGGGRLGGERITTKNLLVVKIDEEKNLIYLRGSVPGARNAYVALKRAKRG